MKYIVTTGIVLARTDFGEADRILTILTADQGKIKLMAKGVRRLKSKLAGGIELFSVSQLTYIPGKRDIGTLASARLQTHFGKIVQDIDRTMYGYEVLKSINQITEDITGKDYFDLLSAALAALDNAAVKLEFIRLWLDMQLLKLTGHTPNLRTDLSGQALGEDKHYGLDVEDMNFVEQSEGIYGAGHIKLLRLAISIESPTTLLQVQGIEAVLADCLLLARSMRQQFLRI